MPAALAQSRNDVFINCPFDADYEPLFRGLLFTILKAGFYPRCALEIADSSVARLEKIMAMIGQSQYGVHDLSRTETDPMSALPRFNMPFELGVFLACKRFGGKVQRTKSCLILDREPYRYRQFLSDISGLDISTHGGRVERMIRRVRDWLRAESHRPEIPGSEDIIRRYRQFQDDFPDLYRMIHVNEHTIAYADLAHTMREWLQKDSPART